MQQTVGTVEGTLRLTRKVHGMLLAGMTACLLAVEGLLRPAEQSLGHVFYESIGILAFLCAGASFAVRYRMLRSTFEALRENPVDADALKRWRSGEPHQLYVCIGRFFLRLQVAIDGRYLYASGAILFRWYRADASLVAAAPGVTANAHG